MWNGVVTSQVRQNKAAYLLNLSTNSEERREAYTLK
jgi:hypothetical protein